MRNLPAIPDGFELEGQNQQIPPIPTGFELEGQQPQLGQSNQWQPPTSKLDAVKRGLGIVKDFVQGNAEYEGMGDTASYWRKQQAKRFDFSGLDKEGIKNKLLSFNIEEDMAQTGVAVFGNDEDTKNHLIKTNPNLKFSLDQNGNEFFTDEDGEKFYINKPGADVTQAAKMVGQGLTYASGGALPGLAKTVLGKTAVGVATQGGLNAATQKLAGRENIDLGEAGMAAAGGALFETVPAIFNKVRNARLGNLNVSDDAAQAVKFADENKLPLYFDDVTSSGTAKKIGQQLDEIPVVGGVKSRQIQNEAQKGVAENFTKKFKLPDNELDDLHGMVSQGAKNHLKRSQEIATQKFTKVYEKLDKAGEFDIPEIKEIATDLIESELRKGSGANQALINEAKSYLEVGKGNFSHWSEIRSDLVAKVRDASKGANETIGTKATGALKRISTVLNKSLDDVAENVGGSQAWRDANSFYNNAVVRYKHGALKTAMKEDNPEKMLNLMIGTGRGAGNDSKHVANQVFSSLDKQGKAAVRHGMMQKAYTEALGETGAFSPAKYASMLERFENRMGVFLSKEDKHFVQGLNKYTKFTQSAGDYAANIKTGQKAVGTIYGLAAGASAASNPLATAAGIAGIVTTKKLFRTTRGRSLMLAFSNIPEGKNPPPALLREITRFLAVNQDENN